MNFPVEGMFPTLLVALAAHLWRAWCFWALGIESTPQDTGTQKQDCWSSVHSHLIDHEKVVVHFEQPVDSGFRSARCKLPGYNWTENDGFSDEKIQDDGFSDEKIQEFVQFLKSNAHLLFRFAKRGKG